MKKRVLQFIGSFHQGGSERQAVLLTRLLKNEGSFEVFVATLNNEGILRTEIEAVDLPEIPEFPLTSFYNANFVRQLQQCVAYLRRNKIDLVHTHDFYTNVFGITAARIAGVPVRIASKRETAGMRSDAQKLAEKAAFKFSNAIVVNSAAVRDHLKRSGIGEKKIHLIYNGIDVDRSCSVDEDRAVTCEKFGVPMDEQVRFVTMVANLRHDVKNVPMLLRVAKRVSERNSDIHFIVAGEGELEMGLKNLANELGVAEKVHFIGRCDDVPALLGISSVCVLTSTAEGFSNSILEYMAAGKPVVATNVGGAAEAIADGETGFLVTADDDIAMSNRVMELLDDEERSVMFGSRGKSIVSEKFSQETQLQATIELYNSLLLNDAA